MKNPETFLKIISFDELSSTNDYAFDLSQRGQKEVTVVRANSQAKGRGRRDNIWFSPAGKGIYASFLLRPCNHPQELVLLPIFISLAVANVLNREVSARLKWPNDIMIKDKKIAGVLLESRTTNKKIEFVIAGVGININAKKDEIPLTATSLLIETKKQHDVELIFKELLRQVLDLYNEFKKGNIDALIDKTKQFIENEDIIAKLSSKQFDALSKTGNGGIITLR